MDSPKLRPNWQHVHYCTVRIPGKPDQKQSHFLPANVPTFLFSNKIFVSNLTIPIMNQQQLKRAIALNNKAVCNLSLCSKKHIAYDYLKRAHQMIRRTMIKQSTSSKSDNDRRLRDMGCVCHDSFPLHFTKDNLRDGYIYNRLLTIDIDQLPFTPESCRTVSRNCCPEPSSGVSQRKLDVPDKRLNRFGCESLQPRNQGPRPR
jgi:hypothetical protein